MGNKFIKRVWNISMHFLENKGLNTFISDNKLLIYLVGFYFCFEELFDSLCNVYLLPILKYFTVSVMSSIVFILLLTGILYNGCRKYKRRVLVSNKTIGFSILSYIFGENIVYVLILLIHYLFLLLVMSILFHFWWENISF